MLGLRFVHAAERQLERVDAWWRENRPAAPELLAEELREALAVVRGAPEIGVRHRSDALPDVRRVLLPQTRFHAYYVVREGDVVVVAVWSALRGHGPPLRAP